MKTEDLKPRAWDVLRALHDLHRDTGYPPTTAELAEALGLANPTSVHRCYQPLEAAGLIARTPNVARSTRVTEKGRRALRGAA